MSGFDDLASSYDQGRSGYSNSVYDELIAFGARPESRVLDVGCGTGLASAPLLAGGFAATGVDLSESMLDKARDRMPDARWIAGDAAALPFAPRTFDVAISAQTFHWLDRARALAEMARVLVPGGVVGIWWKNAQRTLRVLPWQIVTSQNRYLDYERSRLSLREALGDRHADFVTRLGARIAAMYGGDSVPLSYIQYLYLGKT